MTAGAFENAARVLLAIGGSTNAVIHLTAVAGRLGVAIEPGFFDRLSEETPLLVNLKPSGIHYMEDLHNAGGLPVVLAGDRRNRFLQAQLHQSGIDGE